MQEIAMHSASCDSIKTLQGYVNTLLYLVTIS